MAREKKPVHRVQITEEKRNIIHQLLEEYDIQSLKTSRMPSRTFSAAPSKKWKPRWMSILVIKIRIL